MEFWKTEKFSALRSAETGSADAFATAVAAGEDIVDTHLEASISKILEIPYLLAKCILQLARDTQRFHVLGIYIARQALRLVLLLNETIIDDVPNEQQLEERDKLRDDFINLERSMSLWASAPGTNEGYEQHVQEAEQLFNQFFTARFYFDNTRNSLNDETFKALLAYDQKIMNLAQWPRNHGPSSVGTHIGPAGQSQALQSHTHSTAGLKREGEVGPLTYRQKLNQWFGHNEQYYVIPEYREEGPQHARLFQCTYNLDRDTSATGEWRTNKAEAKESAAKEALKILYLRHPPQK